MQLRIVIMRNLFMLFWVDRIVQSRARWSYVCVSHLFHMYWGKSSRSRNSDRTGFCVDFVICRWWRLRKRGKPICGCSEGVQRQGLWVVLRIYICIFLCKVPKVLAFHWLQIITCILVWNSLIAHSSWKNLPLVVTLIAKWFNTVSVLPSKILKEWP